MDKSLLFTRLRILEASTSSREGHLASSLSCLELLFVISINVFGNSKSLKGKELKNSGLKNYLILSKGHAALAFYSILENLGVIDSQLLDNFVNINSPLGGHPDSTKFPFANICTGSLGHGLPVSTGLAFSKRLKEITSTIYVVCGDGEFMEGSNWEALILISRFKLNNLKIFIDWNNTHLTENEIISLVNYAKQLGFYSRIINGNDIDEVQQVVNSKVKKPSLVICKTTLGHGIPELEGDKSWHHKFLNQEEYSRIKNNLMEDGKN